MSSLKSRTNCDRASRVKIVLCGKLGGGKDAGLIASAAEGGRDVPNQVFQMRLQQLRERRRISRRVLSELCGLNPDAVRRYERGEADPSIAAVIALADELGVSVDYLLGRTDRSYKIYEKIFEIPLLSGV